MSQDKYAGQDTFSVWGDARVVIRNNRIITGWSGTQYSPTNEMYVTPIELAGIDSSIAKHYVIENNYLESGTYGMVWANDNANPEMVRQMSFVADTFMVHNSAMSSVAFLLLRTPDSDDHNQNIFQDCQFDTANGMDFTDIINPTVAHSFYVKNTMKMVVMQAGLPAFNAACSVWNDYGQLVANGFSDMNGEFSEVITYHFESNAADSTGYNDHLLKAIIGSDSLLVNYTIEYDDKLDSLFLSGGAAQAQKAKGMRK